jgi:hypothetical protein
MTAKIAAAVIDAKMNHKIMALFQSAGPGETAAGSARGRAARLHHHGVIAAAMGAPARQLRTVTR